MAGSIELTNYRFRQSGFVCIRFQLHARGQPLSLHSCPTIDEREPTHLNSSKYKPGRISSNHEDSRPILWVGGFAAKISSPTCKNSSRIFNPLGSFERCTHQGE